MYAPTIYKMVLSTSSHMQARGGAITSKLEDTLATQKPEDKWKWHRSNNDAPLYLFFKGAYFSGYGGCGTN